MMNEKKRSLFRENRAVEEEMFFRNKIQSGLLSMMAADKVKSETIETISKYIQMLATKKRSPY